MMTTTTTSAEFTLSLLSRVYDLKIERCQARISASCNIEDIEQQERQLIALQHEFAQVRRQVITSDFTSIHEHAPLLAR